MKMNLNLIAAACEGMGIGVKGTLPWRLKSEIAYFTSMTTNTKDSNKKNVVLMGRRTWESIPKKYKPLQNRINIVLTSQPLDYGDDAIVCRSIPHALEVIKKPILKDQIEGIWVIGGSSVYKAAMESPNFHRLYLTRIKKHFACDTFFPAIPDNFVLIEALLMWKYLLVAALNSKNTTTRHYLVSDDGSAMINALGYTNVRNPGSNLGDPQQGKNLLPHPYTRAVAHPSTQLYRL